MQRASITRTIANWIFLIAGIATLLFSVRYLTHKSAKGAKKKGGHGFAFVVVTAKAKKGEIVRALTVSGDVAPYRSFTLRSEIDAPVASVLFRPGQRVKKGDLLLTFDRSDLDLAVRHKQALLRKSQAALQRAEAQLSKDKDDYNRLRRLRVGRTVTESELERARFQVKASEAGVSEMKAAIALQRVELDMAKRNLERAELRAPRNGVINGLFVEEGDQVTRGTKLFEVTGSDRLEVHLLVPLRYSDEVPLHANVRMRLVDRTPHVWLDAKIDRKLPVVDPMSRTQRVIITLEKWPRGYAPNLPVTAKIELERRPNALLVKKDALIRFGREWVVFTIKNNKAQRIPVEILTEDESRVEVKGSVKVGDPVVVVGNEALFPFAPVRVVGGTVADRGTKNKPSTKSEPRRTSAQR